jgi:hypothetical protein
MVSTRDHECVPPSGAGSTRRQQHTLAAPPKQPAAATPAAPAPAHKSASSLLDVLHALLHHPAMQQQGIITRLLCVSRGVRETVRDCAQGAMLLELFDGMDIPYGGPWLYNHAPLLRDLTLDFGVHHPHEWEAEMLAERLARVERSLLLHGLTVRPLTVVPVTLLKRLPVSWRGALPQLGAMWVCAHLRTPPPPPPHTHTPPPHTRHKPRTPPPTQHHTRCAACGASSCTKTPRRASSAARAQKRPRARTASSRSRWPCAACRA